MKIVEGIQFSRRIGPHDLRLVNTLMEITKGVLKLEKIRPSEVPKVISQTDFILHQNKVNSQNEIVDTLYSTVYIQILVDLCIEIVQVAVIKELIWIRGEGGDCIHLLLASISGSLI